MQNSSLSSGTKSHMSDNTIAVRNRLADNPIDQQAERCCARSLPPQKATDSHSRLRPSAALPWRS